MSENSNRNSGNQVRMSEAYIDDARRWASELVQRESRGHGDQENAMRRLEARYGIPWRTLHNLKYRPPADIFISIYERLRTAYVAECERQMRLLSHEAKIAKAKGLAGAPVVAEVEAAISDPVADLQEHD